MWVYVIFISCVVKIVYSYSTANIGKYTGYDAPDADGGRTDEHDTHSDLQYYE